MSLKRLFWFLAALFVPTAIALIRIDADLRTIHAPLGIVSFEFCGFTNACTAILADWGERGRALVMLSLGLDYLFLLSYAGMLCTALLLVADAPGPRGASLVGLVAVGAAGAGLADAAENYALIQIVLGANPSAFGPSAGVFASVKFALVLTALLTWAGLGLRKLLLRRG